MARETGLEPATSGVTGRRSNQLSYSPARRRRIGRNGVLPDRIGQGPSQAQLNAMFGRCAIQLAEEDGLLPEAAPFLLNLRRCLDENKLDFEPRPFVQPIDDSTTK
jgi:hypothetical protein